MTPDILDEWHEAIESILTPRHCGHCIDAGEDYRRRADMAYKFIEANAARLIVCILALKGDSDANP